MKKKLLFVIILWGLLSNLHAQSNNRVSFAYDRNGNRVSSSIVIIRTDENAISNDTIGEYYDPTEDLADTGTDTFDDLKMSIYPNPTCGSLTISTEPADQNNTIHASLLAFNGDVIEEKTITAPETEFDLAGHPAGVYFLITSSGGEKHFWKIIKKQ